MPCLTTWAHSCSAVVLPVRTMLSPKGVQKQSHGCSCQGCKATTTPKPSETLELSASTNRNPPEPSELASGTYTSTHRNPLEPSGTCLRNLHHHTPGLSRTFRNLPPEILRHTPEPSFGTYTSTRRNPAETTPALRNLPELAPGTYTSTHRNPPQPSGTFLRNLHQHTPEPSGTFRNLPPEPTPAHAGTLRNLPPEPAPATRTGTHRSLSGLKTPLAYAVGEKTFIVVKPSI